MAPLTQLLREAATREWDLKELLTQARLHGVPVGEVLRCVEFDYYPFFEEFSGPDGRPTLFMDQGDEFWLDTLDAQLGSPEEATRLLASLDNWMGDLTYDQWRQQHFASQQLWQAGEAEGATRKFESAVAAAIEAGIDPSPAWDRVVRTWPLKCVIQWTAAWEATAGKKLIRRYGWNAILTEIAKRDSLTQAVHHYNQYSDRPPKPETQQAFYELLLSADVDEPVPLATVIQHAREHGTKEQWTRAAHKLNCDASQVLLLLREDGLPLHSALEIMVHSGFSTTSLLAAMHANAVGVRNSLQALSRLGNDSKGIALAMLDLNYLDPEIREELHQLGYPVDELERQLSSISDRRRKWRE